MLLLLKRAKQKSNHQTKLVPHTELTLQTRRNRGNVQRGALNDPNFVQKIASSIV